MNKEILTALYENKRLLILTTFLNHPKSVDPALAYAYQHRLEPIYHEAIAREKYDQDCYADIYNIKAEFIDKIVRYIDANYKDESENSIDFYTLESEFGGGSERMNIVFALEYMRLSRLFDNATYDKIISSAPSECDSIATTFEPKEIYLS